MKETGRQTETPSATARSSQKVGISMVKIESKTDWTTAQRIARKTGNTVVYKVKGKRGEGRIVPFGDGRVVTFPISRNA
jgi:hypothetical protein